MRQPLSQERLQALRNREFRKFYVSIDGEEFVCAADDGLQAVANFTLYELDRCAAGSVDGMRFRPTYRVHEGQRDVDQYVSAAPVVWLDVLSNTDKAIICGRVQMHCHQYGLHDALRTFVDEVKAQAPANQTLFEFMRQECKGLAYTFKLITLEEMDP